MVTTTLRARLGGVWALLHPGPSLLTVAAYVLCAIVAAAGRPNPMRLGVTTLGLVCMQFAISALNDYCDRETDRRNAKKRKPLVLGLVSPAAALGITAVLSLAMFALFAPYGWGAVGLAGTFLALGFAYDLGIKSTPISGVMHGLAFPTLPLLAWDVFAHLRGELFWVLPIGMALGIGLHLADALPDAEADAAAGAHGLTQALGRAALPVCWGAFAVAAVIVAGLAATHPRPTRLPALIVLEALALALVATALITFGRHTTEAARWRQNFLLLVGAALATVVAWFTVIA
ncbi:MAG: UbiA prenyltransferase family protein [Ktedonobacterales bacterium]|nr:UbiA prenyltransferase family protein [Ktedonobacterales bacterium]